MSVTANIAASRQIGLEHALEVAAQNLATPDVSGYQANIPVFSQYIKNGAIYTQDQASIRDLKPGPVIRTDDPFHLTINEVGYFAVEVKSGAVEYTRGGTFRLDAERFVTTPQGDYVLDEGLGKIQIPETSTDIMVGNDGTLSDQQGQLAKVGVFMTTNPLDQQNMKWSSEGYLNSSTPLTVVEFPSVIQGAYEGSNVNTIQATTDLISITREYQQNMKFIEEDNKMQTDATQRLVKLAP